MDFIKKTDEITARRENLNSIINSYTVIDDINKLSSKSVKKIEKGAT